MVRDDIVEYSLEEHHSEEKGREVRKKIWKVTAILSVVTLVEVLAGVFYPKANVSSGAWTAIKVGYILLTLLKAGYIIMVFMHLGDERSSLRKVILWPYIVFIVYLIFILIKEAGAVNDTWTTLY